MTARARCTRRRATCRTTPTTSRCAPDLLGPPGGDDAARDVVLVDRVPARPVSIAPVAGEPEPGAALPGRSVAVRRWRAPSAAPSAVAAAAGRSPRPAARRASTHARSTRRRRARSSSRARAPVALRVGDAGSSPALERRRRSLVRSLARRRPRGPACAPVGPADDVASALGAPPAGRPPRPGHRRCSAVVAAAEPLRCGSPAPDELGRAGRGTREDRLPGLRPRRDGRHRALGDHPGQRPRRRPRGAHRQRHPQRRPPALRDRPPDRVEHLVDVRDPEHPAVDGVAAPRGRAPTHATVGAGAAALGRPVHARSPTSALERRCPASTPTCSSP